MTMGLGGFWRYNTAKKSKKEEPKYTLLTFQADDGTKMWYVKYTFYMNYI